MTKKHYDGSKIRILENLEPIRLRPAMYIGDTGVDGLHHIVEEVVANAVDEHMDGHVTGIGVRVETEAQIVTVIDNGRGIPVTKHKKTKLPLLTAVFTKLHSGGKFGQGAYTSAVAGLHGIGVKATNALSDRLAVWTVQNGWVHHQMFEKGEPVTKVTKSRKGLRGGTKVRFQPDFSIFKDARLDPDRIRRRLQEIAYLCPGLIVEFKVNDEETERFQANDGVLDMLRSLCADHTLQHEPVLITGDAADVAFVWTDKEGGEQWRSFVNVTHTPDHGVHVNGAKKAIQQVLAAHANGKMGKLKGDDLRDGLIGVVHAHVLEPQFRGQTKRSLQNREVAAAVSETVDNGLRMFASGNSEVVQSILERAVALRDAKKKFREQQKAIKDVKVKAGAKSILPGKLCEAPYASTDERELFLVEGDSAFGTVKKGRVARRDGRHFQEILPLRGKVMNAAKKGGLDEVLKNAELSNITLAIGTGIGPDFDLSKCRCKSVFLLMDADADGSHIQALLLAFFVKYMPKLIEAGKLHIADTPLFRGVTNKERAYGDSAEEVKEKLKSTNNVRITRFKGLGELSAEELRACAMHPKTRTVCKVKWGGPQDAEEVLRFMGLDVEARKELLEITDGGQ